MATDHPDRPGTDTDRRAVAVTGDADDQARAQIERTERAESESRAEERRAAKAARAFDLRRVIGGLLALYGLILTVLGLAGSSGDKTKAAGLNVNLWAGLAMLAAGALFVIWSLTRPLRPEDVVDEEVLNEDVVDEEVVDDGDRRPGRERVQGH